MAMKSWPALSHTFLDSTQAINTVLCRSFWGWVKACLAAGENSGSFPGAWIFLI